MRKPLRIVLLVILSALIAFPFFYLFQLSFFSPQDFLQDEARFFPERINFKNYEKALSYRYLPTQLINSIATATLTSAIRIVVITLSAFAFSHLRFKGRNAIFVALSATLFVPQDALLYQNYRTIASLGLLDSYIGIIATSLFSASQMVLLTSAFSSVSKDFYDNARIDGASDLRYIITILTPLAKSILITILLQSFIGAFNSYLWALLVTNKPQTRTIQIGLTMLGFAEEGEIGAQMASVFLVVLPFAIALGIGKKWIEKALISTSMHT